MIVERQPPTPRSSGSALQGTCWAGCGKVFGVSITGAPLAHDAATIFRIRSLSEISSRSNAACSHQAPGRAPRVRLVMACKQRYRADHLQCRPPARPRSRSPGRRPTEPTHRVHQGSQPHDGVSGHRNVIRMLTPDVYRPRSSRPALGLREGVLDGRTDSWAGRCDAGSRRDLATSVSGVAPCVTSNAPKED